MKLKKNNNQIEILDECQDWSKHPNIKNKIRLAIKTCLNIMSVQNKHVCLLLSHDKKILQLSKKYLNKNCATNVLSFPSNSNNIDSIGDIIVSYGVCFEEAEKDNIAFDDHISHLCIHGILHLLGYDHVKYADFVVMRNLEIQALEKLDIANPYDKNFK